MPGETSCASILLLIALATQAQVPARKVFQDAKYGVTFHYPAQWSASPDAVFYLSSEIGDQNPDVSPCDQLQKLGSLFARETRSIQEPI